MLEELKKNSMLYNLYLQSLITRSACASASMEGKNASSYVFDEAGPLTFYLQAFDFLFNSGEISDFRDTLYNLPKISSLMTDGEYDSYRNVQAIVNGSRRERSHPKMIRNDLMYLYKNYEGMVDSGLDIYYIEAVFHINFLMIHPFGDGNGRIARMLLIYNFITNGIAPPVIPYNLKRLYCNFIEDKDYQGLADFFRMLSKREELTIDKILSNNDNKKTRN